MLEEDGGARLQIFPDDGSVSFTPPFPDAETVEEDGVVVRWRAKPFSTGVSSGPRPTRRQPVQEQLPALTPKQVANAAKQNKRSKNK